ncbi:MAG: undecaprenyl-diphosphate phosphatase [Defluviitaleaceae bacterium]|nr:undecaprenyl-diphosphate phosphatase [Defluviitaleaceae bacterium]
MSIFEAIILGILQGIAEFIPISSSGHLILLQRVFGIEENLFSFTILVHIGTLIPVLIIYFYRIKSIIFNPFQKLTLLLVVGTLPIVFFTLLFDNIVDMLFSGNFLVIGFLVTAIILLLVDSFKDKKKTIDKITYLDALSVGLMQSVAIVPGISRSGSTIFGGVLRGISKKDAANFSFLLSIPAIVGATVLEIINILQDSNQSFGVTFPDIFGFFSAMITGYFAIKIMLKLIINAKMKYFSYYLIGLSLIMIFDKIFTNFVF